MMDFAHLEKRMKTEALSSDVTCKQRVPNEPRKEVLLVCFGS